jgi:hypothetical protein
MGPAVPPWQGSVRKRPKSLEGAIGACRCEHQVFIMTGIHTPRWLAKFERLA